MLGAGGMTRGLGCVQKTNHFRLVVKCVSLDALTNVSAFDTQKVGEENFFGQVAIIISPTQHCIFIQHRYFSAQIRNNYYCHASCFLFV